MAQHNGGPRIGVYVCQCGTNIGGKVNVGEVVEFARGLPFVAISKEYKFMCSDPGQELIKQDIKEHSLDRVLVAACSPLMHEATFRRTTEEGGTNPFLFHHVNIREQVSWVTEESEDATDKAKVLISAAARRVALHVPLERKRVSINPDVLVLGGGIAGIQAALTLAEGGRKVYLVEREPSIGGHMAMFDKTFPTLDCSACILTPKMVQVGQHPNIELLAYSEVEEVSGYVGNFDVRVRRKARYVDEDKCNGCGLCTEKCPWKNVPSEFDLGLGNRPVIYIPFAQAVPRYPVLDRDHCVYFTKGGKCKACQKFCPLDAIDFDQADRTIDIKVGAAIVATGFRPFDAGRNPQLSYGRLPNVITSLEFERLASASGPTEGKVTLKDGSTPERVGIIHCVGSRDVNYNIHCSRVCCMASLKFAHVVQERSGAEVYNFYIDMRAAGKGYEEFYHRLMQEGTHFIRGRVAVVTDSAQVPEEEGHLIVQVEDTLTSVVRRIPLDMVILAVGMEPRDDAEEVRRHFGLSTAEGGFFMEKHPKLAPISTLSDGVYLAGACQGPKDIPDSVAQGQAAGGEALALVDKGFMELEPNTAYVQSELCSGCHICLGLCPFNAISFDEGRGIAALSEVLCKGCGVCVASCPSGALQQHLFGDDQIFAEIEGLLADVRPPVATA
ncbi:MAG TPA: CoB--CoM heterodisulfide reductase iron-sulfur subunit A family protein [Thermoleophilia bacterium]|nr:CoB--CoM heterodisulfide reductase iron-sulfur subunit A family protein [Thermoleophilia bacterium]